MSRHFPKKEDRKPKIPKHISELIYEGEGLTLDFKYEISDSKKIAKTLVAFANTEGGILLIGVKDNGKIAGIKTDEEIFMIEAAAKIYSKPPINIKIKDWKIGEKTILEIIIPKSTQKPHFAKNDKNKWIAYIRNEDKTLPANAILLEVWKRFKNKKPIKIKFTNTEKFLLDYLSRYEKITIDEFIKLAQINYSKAKNILIDFILLNLIEIHITETEIFYTLKEMENEDFSD